jgi:hypothetical protein
MDWLQFIIFCAGIFGLFFWNRSESRSDMRMMLGMIDEMKKETKEFHAKLCVLEERYLQILTKK